MNLFGRFRGAGAVAGTNEVDVETARSLQLQGAQFIDVREPNEFKGGRAAGARNIPLDQLENRAGEIAADRTVLLICRSGNRSRVAQDLLRRRGIIDTRNVRGGMLAWHSAGLPEK